MKKCFIGFALLFCCAAMAFSQLATDTDGSSDHRLQLARSAEDYPVTPGDVYLLSYFTPGGFSAFEIVVRSDYSASIGIFGPITAKDLTALQFFRVVEEKVRKAYPEGKPQLVLKSVGVFTVYIKGEVLDEKRVECWGLSSLADVLEGRLAAGASIRNVEILSKTGTTKSCDLFRAKRTGTRDGNPYVGPGDIITVKKAQVSVTIRGEVFKPGAYELLPGETLRDLIENYAEGFTAMGDPARVYVRRTLASQGPDGEAFVVDAASKNYADFKLTHLDAITVASRQEKLPVVYFEGALNLAEAGASGGQAVPERSVHQLVAGEKLSAALREVKQYLSPLADLRNAYIVRAAQTETIPVDLEALLYDYAPEKDIALEPGDRIIIPVREFFVTVSGAVLSPGRYPWAPNRTYRYYLQLAGGCDPVKNVGEAVVITDNSDSRQDSDRIIQPEDRIFAEYNNGLYHFQQWGIVFTTTISLATLVISIIELLR